MSPALIAQIVGLAARFGLKFWPPLLAAAGFLVDQMTGGFAALQAVAAVFGVYASWRAVNAPTTPMPLPIPLPIPSPAAPARFPILKKLLARIFNR